MAKELVENILLHLEKKEEVNSLDLVKIFKEDHQKIIGAIKSLETLENVIEANYANKKQWELTQEGLHVVEKGSHEAAVYNFVTDEGVSQAEVMEKVPYAKVGFSKALAAGWIKLDKSSGKPVVFKAVPSIVDTTRNNLINFYNLSDSLKAEYKKRKLLQETVIKSVNLKKGVNFVTKIVKQDADLTHDLLVNSAWKEKSFKPYNFNAMGAALDVGHLHPLLKVRAEFRKIFLEMGFTEMPTNNFVESSFWNFDALFQPQQHPARDAHDTFFISRPKYSTDFPEDYLEKVKQVHSKGGYGSEGYRYDWKLEEAQKNLLRTHTTAVSARMLYKLMREGEFKPVRYFSIDRVFRNETLDATHLAEFHQVEGVIADYNLTLGDLIGTLYEFFKKLGIDKLEFKPAYNPYTEPSMEIFCFHEGLGKWIEIGNSGVFRPEMLLPMGLPEKVNVIAWGLSLERPTMIKYKLNNIRDLVGSKMDLQMVYNNPICRLEKMRKNFENENIQNANIVMDTSKKQSNKKKQNLTIFCDPEYPILWFESIILLLKKCYSTSILIYNHSTIEKLPDNLKNFLSNINTNSNSNNNDIIIHFIWKKVGIDPVLIDSKLEEIFGAINIARFFNRLIESVNSSLLIYESSGYLYANIIDSILEKIHVSIHSKKLFDISNELNKLTQLNGNKKSMSIIDIIMN